MLLRVDSSSGLPIFEQLAASVRSELARGTLRAGDRLPGAREVADALQVNIHTVLKAYQQLRDEGILDLRRGRGAVVTDAAALPAGLVDEARALVERARAAGVAAPTLLTLIREEYDS
jgi:GntR family transcriptional regulator